MSSLTKVKDLQVAGGFFMYQKVYIDIVFAANLIMDYVLLRLVGRMMRCKCRRTRCAAAAVMGAFFSCVLLFIPAVRYRGVLILFHCICAMGMIRISYGIKKGALLLKTLLMLYLTAFLWGGFWEAFLKNKRMTVQLFLLTVLSTYGILGTLLLVGDYIRICRRNIYPVTIFFAGKKSASYGFYDTGNLLTDPFSGQPVSIVQTEIHGRKARGAEKYRDCQPETSLSVFKDHRTGREADTGSDTGEILYSDPWRRGMYTRSGDGSYF